MRWAYKYAVAPTGDADERDCGSQEDVRGGRGRRIGTRNQAGGKINPANGLPEALSLTLKWKPVPFPRR